MATSTRFADHPAIASQSTSSLPTTARRATAPIPAAARLAAAHQRFSADEFVLQRSEGPLRRSASAAETEVDYAFGTVFEVSCVEVAPERGEVVWGWYAQQGMERVEGRLVVRPEPGEEGWERLGDGDVLRVEDVGQVEDDGVVTVVRRTGKRKFSVGVREFGRRIGRKVSKICRQDSAQEVDDPEAIPLLQHLSTSPPPYTRSPSSEPIPPTAPPPSFPTNNLIEPSTLPPTLPDTSLLTPTSHNDPTSGPAGTPSARTDWFAELELRLLQLKADDLVESSGREQRFARLLGNCTTEARQWEADVSHQFRAEEEKRMRCQRGLEARRVFADFAADLGNPMPVATGGQLQRLQLRRVSAREDLSAAGVVAEAPRRRGSEFVRLRRC